MKKFLITSLAAILNVAAFGQGSIWATVDNIDKVKESDEFKSMVYSINSDLYFTKAFPSSKNKDLQNVYEFNCKCSEAILYAELYKVPGLSRIESAPVFETLQSPNDYTATFTNNWALDLIGAQTAWNYTTGDPTINVAVSDQNYYVNHEELTGKINYYDNTNTATRTHGTAVATIIAGNTNNSIGLSSIGYNSSLSLYRMNYNDVLMASYAGARVINLSWASGCSFNPYVQAAIDEVYNNGTFIIAAAGNGTTCGGADNLVYPAAYNHVFSVTSIGSHDNIERTIGNASTRHQTNSLVDLSAPGFDVPLTAAPGWYLTSSGTSFAAPYVTGTVALMLSLKPDLTNSEIDSILKITSTNIDALNSNYIGKMGEGRLNSAGALRMVQYILDQENIVTEDDGNNGHGNDEDGQDDSNPGQGNGNGRPSKKSMNITDYQIYDMNGKLVNIEYAPAGMYLVVSNNVVITKIIK